MKRGITPNLTETDKMTTDITEKADNTALVG